MDYTSGSYDSDHLLQPMIRILSFADCQKYVSRWQKAINATSGKTVTYGVLYYGVRSFTTSDGLEYLPGDVMVTVSSVERQIFLHWMQAER